MIAQLTPFLALFALFCMPSYALLTLQASANPDNLLSFAKELGTTGLIILVIWKMADRWAGKFLEVQNKQATAMESLAGAVRESSGEQRELLLAVRVLAAKVDETKGWIKDLDDFVRRSGAK